MAATLTINAETMKAAVDKIKSRIYSKTVEAGLIEGAITLDDRRTDLTYPEIITYAVANEYGTNGAPPRPFMRRAFASRSKAWGENIKRAIQHGLTVDEALDAVGQIMASDIKASIDGAMGSWPDNSKEWKEFKTRVSTYRGRAVGPQTDVRPLIFTGAMIRSIGYKITDGGDED